MKCMPIILINMCKNTSSPHAGIKPPTLRMTMASPISRLRILQGSTLESQELKMRYCMGTLRAHSMSFVLHYKSFCWWHCLLVRVLCIWWSIIKERHLVTNIQEVINDSVSCWSLALRAQICIDQPSRLLLLQCLFFT